MRGGALPPALLFAALGLAIAFLGKKAIAACLAILALTALVVGLSVRIGPEWRDTVFLGCWISLLVNAASVYLPRKIGPPIAFALAVNTGVWGGAVISASGGPLDFPKSLVCVLVCLPACGDQPARRQIAVLVLASWLIAVALLAGTLQITTPTPGYLPDHMD